ncbi:polycomb group RING finger protein 3-like [Lineus longissimus]|uniref:polycomb group RING finger protein 3-like n=1 Tax=Lineus longissimus TaxID=88925 RepID=UPI002B4EFA0B
MSLPMETGKKKLGRPFGAKTGCVAQRLSMGLGRGRGRGSLNKLIRSSILHQKHADLRMKMLNRGKEFPEEEEEPSGGQGNCEERDDEEGRVKVFVPENRTIRLTDINPFITCQLCCGYLINAVTIVECLHTFCHSCLVKHFYVHLKCPACDILVHPTNPMANVKYDQLKQEIVSKLLPSLLTEEEERERKFYISKGLPVPQKEDLSKKTNEPTSEEKKKVRPKERHRLVSLVLEFEGCGTGVDRCRPLSKRFIRVTSNATVQNVQHFIRKKHNLSDNCQIKVCCDMYELNEELSLEYIRQTLFDDQECIIPLQYRFEKRVSEDKSFYTGRTRNTEDEFL